MDEYLFKADWFSVARQAGDVIPVLLVVADSRPEAEVWAKRHLAEVVELASQQRVELPFTAEEVALYDREEFHQLIGSKARASSTFRAWYTYSRLNFLRFRLDWELRQSVVPEQARRVWRNLEEMLSLFLQAPGLGVGHDPGKACFGCRWIADCAPGKHYVLEHGGALQGQIVH
jgi:hypothetical protein